MKRGKKGYIMLMAAGILGKRVEDVTQPQYLAAKALFLAIAYDAFPDVQAEFTRRLKAC